MSNLKSIDGGIVVVTKLEGRIGGSVKHESLQRHSVQLSGNQTMTQNILHTDRSTSPCYRRTHISGDVVRSWITSNCPDWEDKRRWNRMSWKQRLISFIYGFDEGFGVHFEFINEIK